MNDSIEHEFKAMGSNFYVKLSSANKELLTQAENEVLRLERIWSRFLPDSEITLLNNSDGKPVFASEETILPVKKMIEAFRITKGIYDPTILPELIKAGYKSSLVNPSLVTKLSKKATWPGELLKTQIQGNLIFLPEGTTLDPGGIGKGIAADLVCEKLIKEGAAGCLVSAGGDIRVKGLPANRPNWLISIEDPEDKESVISQVKLIDGAVATSSRLKRKFSEDANHLIDTRKGKSATSAVQSVTVVAHNAALAEVLCKVPFGSELDDALRLIENQKSAALVVTEDQMIHTSPSWRRYENE